MRIAATRPESEKSYFGFALTGDSIVLLALAFVAAAR